MPPSQLKRLKSSLRDQGLLGQQKSKKEHQRQRQDPKTKDDKRLKRAEALQSIREQFNPFDLKHNARGAKFDVTTNRPEDKSILGRPSVSKSQAEERRRQTLLVEMQRKNKVGGILDRRIGEYDPNMAEEDKMLERFVHEKQRSRKKQSLFDLEDDDETGPVELLTHRGQTLFEGKNHGDDGDDGGGDDFDEADLALDSDDDDLRGGFDHERQRQRQERLRELKAQMLAESAESAEGGHRKSKHEIMKEIIAKSKMHKYERQSAREEDQEIIASLDKELPEIMGLLGTTRPPPPPTKTELGDTATTPSTSGKLDRAALEKEFDVNVKILAQDPRSQPAERSKTDEERAQEQSAKLQALEEKRRKRMLGEEVSDDDSSVATADEDEEEEDEDFGLGEGIRTKVTATELGLEDEDDFFIEESLVASDSELEEEDEDDSEDDSDNDSEMDRGEEAESDGESDDEFTKALLSEQEKQLPFHESGEAKQGRDPEGLPFTFACPQEYAEFQAMVDAYPDKVITIIQRIRALYHPSLRSENKQKLAQFARVLVHFLVEAPQATTGTSCPSAAILENVIRHLHSLAKSFASDIGRQVRHHLAEINAHRVTHLRPGDLLLLTAIGTIFPTSDHFHSVVTPTLLTMARHLALTTPQTLSEVATSTYVSTLSLQYQRLSKRYLPETWTTILQTLYALSPVEAKAMPYHLLHRRLPSSFRVRSAADAQTRGLRFEDCSRDDASSAPSSAATAPLNVSLLQANLQLVRRALDLWSDASSALETFYPAEMVLQHLSSAGCRGHLPEAVLSEVRVLLTRVKRQRHLAQLARRPLALHHHRPLAIKTAIPRFEAEFDPDKHYDPNRDRAETAKLQAEHKRERKAVLREIRKDSRFRAREQLRMKIARDTAYETKMKRLVAEIQNEEGRESNEYAREKDARKRARLRK